jgi:DNA-binding response OmpR family regulator
LEKVIINLLSNAFKFTPDGGKIQLEIRKIDHHTAADQGEGVVEVRIVDNGQGIPVDKLPHIFERFYQVDSSSTRIQEGTGIGLALAKELIELHHGTISASNNRKQGATFVLHLPLGKSYLQENEIVSRKDYRSINNVDLKVGPLIPEYVDEPEPLNGNNPLVLIIDDNKDMRLYLQEILGEWYQLIEAANGKQGLQSALEHIPDLVISDVMMPKMDGHQLCLELKTDERTSHIPVILLTARAGEEAKLEGLETGADDYITKPFSPVELKARVQNLIELRQRLREQFSKNFPLQLKDVTITSTDQQFLQRALDILEIHRSDTDFNSDAFSLEIGMSRSQLHRKLKALADQSTGDFIRTYRLKYARQLIKKDFGNITQVAYECGYVSPSHFAENFKKQFGVSPSEYARGVV